MSAVVIAGDTSGTVTLDAPAVAGTTVLTLPATSGTVMVNGPAFSAYRNGNQTVTAATFTKVQLDTEEFDTNSNFDSTTNYRFTPTVSGYYQVSAVISFGTTSTITRALCFIAKNGNNYKTGNDVNSSVFSNVATALIYMNGSTDYLELFGWVNGAGTLTFNGNISTVSMQAVLVRGA